MLERLTYREELGVVLVKGVDEKRCHVHCTEKRHSGDMAEDCMNCEINKAFERLAEYEDTKLSPKAIIELNDFEKTQCAKLLAKLGEYTNSGLSPEEVQELAKAKADGRLVEVVRCKDCDMGYVDKDMSSPDRGWWYGCKDHKNHFKRADGYCSMGVPREEAEKALGGGDNDKG